MVTNSSSLTWIDSSERERRTVLELVAAMDEPGTLDELGIGTVRDTIANVLFPGTSTIQTRAKYFLFVPWILQRVETSTTRRPQEMAQRLQLDLCNVLADRHGANEGVIGREARARLQRWPISIYWLGLEEWRVRRFHGSITAYFAGLREPKGWRTIAQALVEPDVDGRGDEARDGIGQNWAQLPDPSGAFPADATLELTGPEAEFLRDTAVLGHPQSWLAYLLQHGTSADVELTTAPWEHPLAQTAPIAIREWLEDARRLSLVHEGAGLLYVLLLARRLGDEASLEAFSNRFREWCERINSAATDLAQWDRTAMWARLRDRNPNIRFETSQFVQRWAQLATAGRPERLLTDSTTHELIIRREHELKHARARLTYDEALDRRRGYPAPDAMVFRWPQASRIIRDILDGIESASRA